MLRSTGMMAFCLSICLLFAACGASDSNDAYMVQPEYLQVLSDYERIISRISTANFEEEFNNGLYPSPDEKFAAEWGAMLIDARNSMQTDNDSFGYILNDVNKDGTQELFLVRSDHTILAVFTLDGKSPKLLGAFWSKSNCFVLESNTLCVFDIGGAQNFQYTIYTIDVNTKDMMELESFGCENGVYYEKANDNSVFLSAAEFNEKVNTFVEGKSAAWKKLPISPITK